MKRLRSSIGCTAALGWLLSHLVVADSLAAPSSKENLVEVGLQKQLFVDDHIIESLETGRVYRGHFNVINQGYIPNLPAGCVIEIPGYVDKNGINMPVVGKLPLACAATCAASVRVQEMGMEAAVRGAVPHAAESAAANSVANRC